MSRQMSLLTCILMMLWCPGRLAAQQFQPLVSCLMSSPGSVTAGNSYTFTITGSCSATSWTCSCGAVTSSTSTSVTILFNSLTCTSATIAALSGSTTLISKTVTITIPPALVPGAISNPTQTINYNTTPAAINASASSGGSCTSYSYLWYSSTDNSTFTEILGSAGQNYQPGPLTVTTYFKRSTSCGIYAGYTTNTATVTVYPQVVTGAISPSTQTINNNAVPTSLTAAAATGGAGTYTYQWYSSPNGTSWSPISGATGLTYAPAALTSTTYYELIATSNGATGIASTATVTVYPPVATGTISPSSQSINYNTIPTLSVSGTTGGNGSYSYQWESSSTAGWTYTPISGATSSSYTPSAGLTSTTYYEVVQTSNGVPVTSSPATVIVYPQLLTGTISPSSQSINYNTTPTLSVSGTTGGNGTYTYQWESCSTINGTYAPISGATSSSFTPSAGLTSTTYYEVLQTSNGVPVTSSPATVIVYPKLLTGSISPSSQTINYNTKPTLSVSGATGGNGIYTYQWESCSTISGTYAPISGATSSSYTPSAGLTANTYYEVVQTSNGVPVTSSPATVIVYPLLATGAISPSTQNINYGAIPTVSVSGTTGGTGSYTYQWESSSTVGGTYTPISGATSSSYTPSAGLTAAIYYEVVQTSNGVSVTSSAATVSVYPQLVTGTISPSTQSINYGTKPTVSVSGTTGGTGSYTYQWESCSTINGTYASISGATSSSYTPSAGLTATTYYEVIQTSNGVSVTSAAATVSVYPQLVTGTISPSSQSINYGTEPTVSVSGTTGGNGSYTYQWESCGTISGTYAAISGATSSSYTPSAGLTATTYYEVVQTSNGVAVTSAPATANVYPQLVTGAISPSTQNINYGTAPTLSVSGTVGGNGSYTYQWESSSTISGTYTAISGATSSSFTPSTGLTASTYYEVVQTSNGVSVTSTAATVSVYPQLTTGTISPSTQSINYGTKPTVSVSGTTGGNGSYTYQWESSSTIGGTYTSISGATSSSYTPSAGLTSAIYYEVVQTSNGVSITSTPATVSVYPQLASGSISPPVQNINYGGTPGAISVSGTTGGTGSYTYQWESSSTVGGTYAVISGATSASYTPPPGLTATTYYELIQTSNGVSVTSGAATVNVYPPLAVGTISVGTNPIAYGADPGNITSTTPTGGSGSYTYQWQSSSNGTTWQPVSGAIGLSYDPGTLYSSTYYELIVTSNEVSATSNVLSVRVNTPTNAPGSDTPPTGTATVINMPTYSSSLSDDSLNFVRTRTITKPGVTDTITADGLTSAFDAHQTTEYYDGLGRDLETVDKQNTPSQGDLIKPVFYDAFGREAQQYLPYSDGSGVGTFRGNANTTQPAFYNTYFNGTESYYYSNTAFEPSPLNRPTQATPPGNSWTGRGIGTSNAYLTNTSADSVRLWSVTYGETDWPTSSSGYAAGTLSVSQITDENGHMIRTYTDLEGHTVLKKVQIDAVPSSGHPGWLCTYYVYDDLNSLRCVIPPKAVATLDNNGWNLTLLQNLCFQYAYDGLKRMILKKFPDAAPVYMVYNVKDLLVMTQDGNLRGQNEWEVTKYDSLDRPAQTGIYSASSIYTLDQMQSNVNANQGYPSTFTVNIQNFYDDYNQTPVPAFTSVDVSKLITPANSYPDPVTQSNQTRGLATTTMVRMLEFPTTLWFTTVNYFDEKGRVIQSNKVNSLTGGYDTTTMNYDFTGRLLSSYERYNNPGSVITPRTTILSSTQYDHMGRIVQTTRQVNDNGINKVVSAFTYDGLGRLNQKTIGSNMESLNYNYNIRGWLRGVNQNYITGGSSHYFGMELNYDYGFGTPQYNGNIAGIKWKSVGSGIARAYGYLYDNVNRLIAAPFYQNDAGDGTTFVQDGKVDFSVPQISYDQNGNILTMNQNGLEITSSAPIDQMTYAYGAASNQLQSVTDAAPTDSTYHLGDFQDGNTSGNDYAYDANGNLAKDLNKKIDSIRYNYLNLPEYVHIKGKGNINYIYDASGVKFMKIVTDSTKGGKIDTTIYIGVTVYHNDTLQFVSDEEGRIRYMNKVSEVSGATLTGMIYDYFLKDHLGDTRMVLTEEQDTTIYAATMELKNAAIEDTLFNNISTTRVPVPSGFEPSSGADTSNHYVNKLWGATGGNRIGPSIVLKVMARDTISANVWGWYQGTVQPPPSNEVPIVNDLLTTLSSDVIGQGGSELSGAVTPVASALSLAMGSFITTNENPTYSAAQPKAFLNWVLFDDQLNYVTGNATQIPAISAGESRQLIPGNLPSVIPKNGYLYIYVSNESQDTVYFDNLNINYKRGPVSEEEHYYPFGLTMSGISDRALQFGKINKYRFQKQEFQFDEFSDHSGLDMYEFKYRFDDPQIGRFWSIDPVADDYEYNSPYAFSEDKVTSDVELEGLEAVPLPVVQAVVTSATAAAFGTSQSTGSTQELPTFNGLVNDINSLQLGARVQGMINQDEGLIQSAGNAVASAFHSIVNLFSKGTNSDDASNSNQGSGNGRGSNNRKPDQDAAGSPHSVIDQNGSTTYKPNPQNPTGYDETERIDVKGGAHKDQNGTPIPTPHKHVKKQDGVLPGITPLDPSKDAIPQYLPGSIPLPAPPTPAPPPVVDPKPASS